MARMILDNRVKVVCETKPNASGVFDWTLASPPSGGYRLPANAAFDAAAAHDPTTGLVVAVDDMMPYLYVADSLYETGIMTILAGGLTASRNSVVFTNSSGTKARIDFSSAAAFGTLTIGWDAMMAQSSYNLQRPRIYGLNLTYTDPDEYGAAPGCAFIEGSNGAPLVASAIASGAQTGTAANFYNVFLTHPSGVPTLSKVIAGTAGSTTLPVAFATPAGYARSKAADPLSRYLGTLLYGATDVIRPFRCVDEGGGRAAMHYLADTGAAAPFLKQIGAGAGASPITYTALDMSLLIPNNGLAVEGLFSVFLQAVLTNAAQPQLSFSLDNSGFSSYALNPSSVTGVMVIPTWLPINPDTTAAMYFKFSDADALGNMYCWGYRYRRGE